MTPLCSIHGEGRVRGCDECWTLMSDRLAESRANAPHIYAAAYARGIEDALRAAKGSDWTRNGVCDAIRRLLPPTEVGK
jgi:hypothetical protein